MTDRAWVAACSCVNSDVSGALTDAELVRIYRATIGPLYGYVSRRVGGDAALAEDLVQDTWMRAVGDWPSRGVPREPLAWLIRVARNTLVSHIRRMRPELVDPAVLDRIERDDSPAADDAEAAAAVNQALARLRRAHAELLEELYFNGRSVRDIAQSRGLSERAVEGRLRRARQKLKKKIEQMRSRAAKRRHESPGEPHVEQTRTP
jgi:RNA polymerase sigma-70 factor (ECF subfamily)